MGKYLHNHVVTAGYIRRFTDDFGNVKRVELAAPAEPKRRRPETVGHRRFFENREIAKTMETRLSVIEGAGLEVLKEIDALWPLESDERFDRRFKLARLVAIHMVRNPDFHLRMAKATAVSISQRLPEYNLDAGAQKELLRHVTSEPFRVGHMMSMIRKTRA